MKGEEMANRKSASKKHLTIVSRQSTLALWQAEFVKKQLERFHPHLQISIIGVKTKGDKLLKTPLNKMGGKGLFVKELEDELLNRHADIAVHSMKDVPTELPAELMIPVILEREDPRDVLVLSDKFVKKNHDLHTYLLGEKQHESKGESNIVDILSKFPLKSKIGTSSLRRQAQFYEMEDFILPNNHHAWDIQPLRGNVDTRIRKLDRGEFDAIILAAAGLIRLGLSHRIQGFFDPEQILPGVGQGALGIECRRDDPEILEIISPLQDFFTYLCVSAERAMNALLGGSCQLPVAGLALCHSYSYPCTVQLRGMVGNPEGDTILRAETEATITQLNGTKEAEQLGKQVAEQLLLLGAQKIIDKVST